MSIKQTICVFLAVTAGLAGWSARVEVPRSFAARFLHPGPAATNRVMWFSDTAGLASNWPFKPETIERSLERAVSAREWEPSVARRYVNDVMGEWAAMQLDAAFTRCPAEVVRQVGAYRVDLASDFWQTHGIVASNGVFSAGEDFPGGWIAAWKVADRLYLAVTTDRAEEHPRDYHFVMWDGNKDWPIAGYESFPTAFQAQTALNILSSPVAANNLAVFLYRREANRLNYMPEYVETLLLKSARGGCEEAYHNLGVLKEEEGDLEAAAAFYSRENAGVK